MEQTFFNFIVTYNGESKNCGLWAKNEQEAIDKACLKWMNADKRTLVLI